MKRIGFYAKGNRSDNLLHIETDGAVINIHVGLTDAEGRLVTRVEVSPDDESRGGDGSGRIWHGETGSRDGWVAGLPGIRVVRQHRCRHCGSALRRDESNGRLVSVTDGSSRCAGNGSDIGSHETER